MREITTTAPPLAVTDTRTDVTDTRTDRSYLELAAAPGAVPRARRHTRHMLAAWKLGHLADDAELVVSELLTNAVRATPGMPPAVARTMTTR